MKVGPDTKVVVRYTLAVEDGETPPELKRTFTARFIYGRDRVMPVLEEALVGLSPEDELEVTIPPEQAFGEYDPQLVREVPISNLKHPDRIQAGQLYEEPTAHSGKMCFVVREVHHDSVMADFNHPAAGKPLQLKAKVEEVHVASLTDILEAIKLSSCSTGGG